MKVEEVHVQTQEKTLVVHNKALRFVSTVFGITGSQAADLPTSARGPVCTHCHMTGCHR